MFGMGMDRSMTQRMCVFAVASASVAAISGLGVGVASAAVGENLPEQCLEFSQDNGTTWGGASKITWSQAKPVPGQEVTHASFQAKNTCETPARLQVYVGNWTVSDNASATVRANAGATKGTTIPLSGTPGKLVVQTARLNGSTPVKVEMFVGIPADETRQGFTIAPDWSVVLEEVARDTPTDPGNPTDPGGSSEGSLGDLFGSLGGSLGSVAGKSSSALKTLRAPVVLAGQR